MFALVDGNNFYCSCERVFQPRLQGRPLVVLSNNDGCAIARSEEAKALGIAMGAPYFQIKHLEKTAGLTALSTNFTLYGDMSNRMMEVAALLGPEQEIYSIDECFIGLHGIAADTLTARAWRTHRQIAQWTGIPNCIGIGPTKTLAKLANHIAKTADRKPKPYPHILAKVCNFAAMNEQQKAYLFAKTAIGDVWGIGRRIARQLQTEGVCSIADFLQLNAATVRKRWSVVLETTWHELHGQPCLQLDNQPGPKQQIAFTRSFGQPVTSQAELASAITTFATRAAHKLRQQHSQTSQVVVFARTSPFRQGDTPYARTIVTPLLSPTNDTRAIVGAALVALQQLYRPHIRYCKAGVLLLGLTERYASQSAPQMELEWEAPLESTSQKARQQRLMTALDAMANRFGHGTVVLGPQLSANQQWPMRQARQSPCYTTRLSDIPLAIM
ncbi:Y-family DNA polymerase [Lampropedia puyangensis]|uniref:Y-family DNA polymerase n=1 Tax=Lampropedia puyangensis TaxID=1330072 RepID=A0A4S8EMQ2_9BURK|nr:Y-family DNA polymerase [Lampropedia puyangensis]THT95967.1 Y-family DNA polymerase [Lampropedia puyangensis]